MISNLFSIENPTFNSLLNTSLLKYWLLNLLQYLRSFQGWQIANILCIIKIWLYLQFLNLLSRVISWSQYKQEHRKHLSPHSSQRAVPQGGKRSTNTFFFYGVLRVLRPELLEDVNVNVNETLTERNVSVNVNLTLI